MVFAFSIKSPLNLSHLIIIYLRGKIFFGKFPVINVYKEKLTIVCNIGRFIALTRIIKEAIFYW